MPLLKENVKSQLVSEAAANGITISIATPGKASSPPTKVDYDPYWDLSQCTPSSAELLRAKLGPEGGFRYRVAAPQVTKHVKAQNTAQPRLPRPQGRHDMLRTG